VHQAEEAAAKTRADYALLVQHTASLDDQLTRSQKAAWTYYDKYLAAEDARRRLLDTRRLQQSLFPNTPRQMTATEVALRQQDAYRRATITYGQQLLNPDYQHLPGKLTPAPPSPPPPPGPVRKAITATLDWIAAAPLRAALVGVFSLGFALSAWKAIEEWFR
jgi:hypothetical protein